MNVAYADKVKAAKRWLGDRYLLARPINKPRMQLPHARLSFKQGFPASLIAMSLLATGCATMHKAGETVDGKARDRYECEQEVYTVAAGNAFMLSNGLYRDCMRARGYR